MLCFKSVLCAQEYAVWKKSNKMDQRETKKEMFIVKSGDVRSV